ncbi:MAG: hypothetical protein ACM3OB_11335 [Acidobacteriota bacterium]
MSRTVRITAAVAAALALAGTAHAMEPAKGAAEQGKFETHTLQMPRSTAPLPYTIELPAGWQARPWLNDQWVLIAPPGEMPGEVGKPANPRAMIVRHSIVDIRDPEAVVANMRANLAQDKQLKVDVLEVREVAGVKGIVSQIESGDGDARRITYGLKVPLGDKSIDFTVSCPTGAFSEYRPLYERIFSSLKKAS